MTQAPPTPVKILLISISFVIGSCNFKAKMIQQGTEVRWKWGRGTATGKVKDVFDHEVTTTIKGTKVTRKGKPENKALFIQQENGNEVLKLESEVEEVN